MSDDDTGPSGTLVIPPEDNPAHRKSGSLTSQDEDPATHVVNPGPKQLEPSPTMQLDVPPAAAALAPTLQMGAVMGGPPAGPAAASQPSESEPLVIRPGSLPRLPSRPGSDVGRITAAPEGPSKFVPLVIGVVVALGVGGVGLWLALRGNPSSKLLHEASNPSETSDEALQPPPAAPPTASAATPTLADADQRARTALGRFRDGLKGCVENTIHKLPGTSPPVPDAMAWFKKGPYTSLKRDWASPVFGCVHFTMEEPMPFAIQWQADLQGAHGAGIVWVDANGDGVADSAYAFTATASGGTVTTTEIEAIDPASKTMVRLP